jgi:hypothetical protein
LVIGPLKNIACSGAFQALLSLQIVSFFGEVGPSREGATLDESEEVKPWMTIIP